MPRKVSLKILASDIRNGGMVTERPAFSLEYLTPTNIMRSGSISKKQINRIINESKRKATMPENKLASDNIMF